MGGQSPPPAASQEGGYCRNGAYRKGWLQCAVKALACSIARLFFVLASQRGQCEGQVPGYLAAGKEKSAAGLNPERGGGGSSATAAEAAT